MRVLVIKTSSLGDVIHTLPALSDAVTHIPGIEFDWVVEEAFAAIPPWHPSVARVIPVAIRRWRRSLYHSLHCGELSAFRRSIREKSYDLVIDAQGLIKSAFITRTARGVRCGLDKQSAREPLAALAYQRKFSIPFGQHAIARVRRLFGAAFGYPVEDSVPDYGIASCFQATVNSGKPYLVFLHGTTWKTKHWPDAYWLELADLVTRNGLTVKIPWGSVKERERAEGIATSVRGVEVLPSLDLGELGQVLHSATGIVGVDTGLVHLAAALGVPSVTVYGATNPGLTGTVGESQFHLQAEFSCSPCLLRSCSYSGSGRTIPACYASVPPALVWERLASALGH
ncbi:MAG: lipopolysaccharide heptosyltransferase I [Gammaproteobacteria bacterium]|nr:lipopolysaccharide heptosyltransferase I [Gammaproteobacteria bacterium]